MTEIYKFSYVRDKPLLIKVIGGILALFFILRFMNNPILSVFLGLGSGFIFIYQKGIEVDFKKKAYRMVTTLGPQTIGKWEALPPIKYVSVFRTVLVSTVRGLSNTAVTEKDEVIQVNLITEKNKQIKLLETSDINKSFEFAKQTAAQLDLRIWDATVRPAKWFE